MLLHLAVSSGITPRDITAQTNTCMIAVHYCNDMCSSDSRYDPVRPEMQGVFRQVLQVCKAVWQGKLPCYTTVVPAY